jgi:orotate phosphoribosyltransferase
VGPAFAPVELQLEELVDDQLEVDSVVGPRVKGVVLAVELQLLLVLWIPVETEERVPVGVENVPVVSQLVENERVVVLSVVGLRMNEGVVVVVVRGVGIVEGVE